MEIGPDHFLFQGSAACNSTDHSHSNAVSRSILLGSQFSYPVNKFDGFALELASDSESETIDRMITEPAYLPLDFYTNKFILEDEDFDLNDDDDDNDDDDEEEERRDWTIQDVYIDSDKSNAMRNKEVTDTIMEEQLSRARLSESSSNGNILDSRLISPETKTNIPVDTVNEMQPNEVLKDEAISSESVNILFNADSNTILHHLQKSLINEDGIGLLHNNHIRKDKRHFPQKRTNERKKKTGRSSKRGRSEEKVQIERGVVLVDDQAPSDRPNDNRKEAIVIPRTSCVSIPPVSCPTSTSDLTTSLSPPATNILSEHHVVPNDLKATVTKSCGQKKYTVSVPRNENGGLKLRIVSVESLKKAKRKSKKARRKFECTIKPIRATKTQKTSENSTTEINDAKRRIAPVPKSTNSRLNSVGPLPSMYQQTSQSVNLSPKRRFNSKTSKKHLTKDPSGIMRDYSDSAATTGSMKSPETLPVPSPYEYVQTSPPTNLSPKRRLKSPMSKQNSTKDPREKMTDNSDSGSQSLSSFSSESLKRKPLMDTSLRTIDGLYACRICQRLFANRFSLTGHYKTHYHQNEKPYLCDDCGRRYTSLNNLRYHFNKKCPFVKVRIQDSTVAKSSGVQEHATLECDISKTAIDQENGKHFTLSPTSNESSRPLDQDRGAFYHLKKESQSKDAHCISAVTISSKSKDGQITDPIEPINTYSSSTLQQGPHLQVNTASPFIGNQLKALVESGAYSKELRQKIIPLASAALLQLLSPLLASNSELKPSTAHENLHQSTQLIQTKTMNPRLIDELTSSVRSSAKPSTSPSIRLGSNRKSSKYNRTTR